MPSTVLLPRILNTPSRLRCDFGWDQGTSDAFQNSSFEQLILRGGEKHVFVIPNLGKKAADVQRLVLEADGEVTGIEQFGGLRNLGLVAVPANGINLRAFSKLERLFVKWDKALAPQIFELSHLKSLAFYPYPYKDLEALVKLDQLNELGITRGSLTTLSGIQASRDISLLSLKYLRNLENLDELASLTGVKQIELANLPNLRAQLRVSELPMLESLYVVDSSLNVDLADVSACTRLEKIWLNVPASGLEWSDLFSLRELKKISIVETPESPADEEVIRRLATENGHSVVDFKKIRLKKSKVRSGIGVQIKLAGTGEFQGK